MDKRTAQQLGQVAPAFVPVARTVTEYLMSRRQMEQHKQMEKELIETRSEAGMTAPDSESDSDGSGDQMAELIAATAVESDGQTGNDAAINRLKDQTECGVCQELLEGVRDLPADEQGVALSEYGRFKGRVEDDAPMDEIQAALDDSEVLLSVLHNHFNMEGE